MTPETIEAVGNEVRRFAQELNLSEAQKAQLRNYLTEKHQNVEEFRRQNPHISRKELAQKVSMIRASMRQHVIGFLTPQQLEKWDAQIVKSNEFLGHNLAA
jgi:hypothetical protein